MGTLLLNPNNKKIEINCLFIGIFEWTYLCGRLKHMALFQESTGFLISFLIVAFNEKDMCEMSSIPNLNWIACFVSLKDLRQVYN